MSNLGREILMGRCSHLHYIRTFKGGFVTEVLNVSRGRPKLKFKNLSDIHERESLLSDDDDAKAVRSCIDVMEEGIVKTEPDVWACDVGDGDVQTIHNMDDEVGGDDDISILTLKQIKNSSKARKRKRSQGLDSSNIKIKIDDPSSPEDCMEKQQTEDDPDFMETLSCLKTKLSKNMKTKKKKCAKDQPMSSPEIVPVDQSEGILDGQEFSPSSGDSAGFAEVKFDCPENDCFNGQDDCSARESKEDHPMSSQEAVLVDQSEEILDGQEFSPSSRDSVAPVEVKFDCPENDCFDGPDDCSGRESKEDHPMSSQEIAQVDQSEEMLDGQEFSPSSRDSAAPIEVKFDCPENDCFHGPDDCSGRESKEEHPMFSQEIALVDQSEEILNGQEFSPSSRDSAAPVEVKFDCPENDCFDGPDDCSGRESKEEHPMFSQEIALVDQSEEILNGQEFSPSSRDSAAPVEVKFDCPENDCFDGPDDCSGRESKEDHPMSSQEIALVDQSEEILDGQEFSLFSGDSAAPVEVKFDCPENDCSDGPHDCSGRESIEDHPMSSQEIVLGDQSEEILDGQEFLPSSGDSAAPVEVKFDYPENDCSDGPHDCSGRESIEDHPMSSQEIVLGDQSEEILDGQEFSPSSGDSAAPVEVKFDCPENDCSDGPDDRSGRESKEDHLMSSQEIVLVDESEEILDGHEFPPSSGDLAAVVEVNFDLLETDCFNEPDDYSGRESKEDTEITQEWNLQNELNNKWIDFFHIPLRMVKPSDMDIDISNSDELSSNQSASFPAIEFEDHDNSDIFYNQLDDDADVPVSPPEVASDKDLDSVGLEVRDENTLLNDYSEDEYTAGAEILDNACATNQHGLNPDGYLVCHSDDSPEYKEKQSFASEGDDDIGTLVSPPKVASHDLELRDDNTLLDDCSKDESTDGAEVQDKLCSNTEQGLNPDGCPVRLSDDSPECDAKKSLVSLYDGERIHVKEATDELTSCDEHEGSTKLHGPERLLSTRKAISPSSQEKLCKAMETIDISHRNNLKCKGKLQFTTEQTDKNGDAERLSVVSRTAVTNNPNKNRVIPKTSRSGSNLQGASKIRNSSRSATHLGCSTLQNCSKSAIAFSKQQMHDAESLTMKLTKELNSMKEIMDDMLRSEFCLNTSLRYKVNEARMAVKNATKAEEGAKRWLSFMSRDCSRFCKIMKLADSSSSTPQNVVSPPQDVVRKEKKIAFADEAGGKLCEVRFYEDDEGHLPESK